MRANLVPLKLGLTDYDHAYPVTSGEVEIAGAAVEYVRHDVPPTLDAFLSDPSWSVADISIAEYVAFNIAGDDRVVALPVFLSRGFRHDALVVDRTRITEPADLRGAAIAVEDKFSADAVNTVGMLGDMYGIGPSDVKIVRMEPAKMGEALRTGEIEAALTFDRSVVAGDIGPLFSTPGDAEREYYDKTKVFPIQRVLVVKRSILGEWRWLASNIFRSFEVARRRYFARLADIRASRVPIAAAPDHYRALQQVFGDDFWPYGVAANRPSLEAFLRYSVEQGFVEDSGVDVADLFYDVEPFVDGM